jgi:O-antigen/teichoic acid export membrane protein
MTPIRVRLSPFLTDILITTLVSLSTVISFVFLARVLAMGLGPEKFGAYSISRRLLATLEPLSTVNLGIALARYTALSPDGSRRFSYLFNSFIVTAGINVLLFLIVICFQSKITSVLFCDPQYLPLLWATMFSVFTYSCFIVLYGFYRGAGMMHKANFLQFLLVAAWPLDVGSAFAGSGRVDRIVFITGLGYLVIFLPLLLRLFKGMHAKYSLKKSELRELLIYGIPRLPGGIAYAGILGIGTIICPFFLSLESAGYLALSVSVLKAVEGAFDSFGRVILPKVAQIYSSEQPEYLRKKIGEMTGFAVHIGLFLGCQLFLWADTIVVSWLGARYAQVTLLMRVFSLAIVPFLIYSILRSVIDAVEAKAINTGNLYVAFGATVLACVISVFSGWGVLGLAGSTATGIFILGILSLAYVNAKFGIGFTGFIPAWCLGLNLCFYAVGVLAKFLGAQRLSGTGMLGLMACVFTLSFILYCWGLYCFKAAWILEAKKRINLRGMV